MITTCPRCAASATITATQPVLVTCPRASCGSTFVAVPGGSAGLIEAELREIAFRCAATARPYFIVFGRLSKSELFTIRKIHDEKGWLKGALAVRRDRTSEALRQLPATDAPPPSVLSLVGQVLLGDRKEKGRTGTALVAVGQDAMREQRLPEAGWQRLSAEEIVARLAPAVRDDAPFNTAEFEFDGFRCCHCASPPHALFVQCTCCHELVCFGRGDARTMFHRCTTACGSEGPVEQRHFGIKGDQHRLPVSRGASQALGIDRKSALPSGVVRQIGRGE